MNRWFHWDCFLLWDDKNPVNEFKLPKPFNLSVNPDKGFDDDPDVLDPPLLPNNPENWPKTELTELPDPWLLFPPVKPPNNPPRPDALFPPPPRRPWALLSISKGPDCCSLPKSVFAIPLTDSGRMAVQSPLMSCMVWIGSRLERGLNLCYYRRLWVRAMLMMAKRMVNERSFISYQ